MKTSIILLALVLTAQGCATVTDAKTLIITPKPGETKIAVTSRATAKCQDFLFIMWCKLYLDIVQQ